MVGCWDIATRFLYNDLLTFHEFINIYTIIKKQTNKQKRQKQKQNPTSNNPTCTLKHENKAKNILVEMTEMCT